ncbi:hypothetical protein WISP_129721 [Willisornis vidua]|uniref:Uncharacterized protein n=1 Tax=Willisornis vidua TaxID=1566151 RepID=A0ABQ9CQX3_9PASS|nr:hypothetical protein WISP_129721 [Willisornis vidua]
MSDTTICIIYYPLAGCFPDIFIVSILKVDCKAMCLLREDLIKRSSAWRAETALPCADMDKYWNDDMDQELSWCGNVTRNQEDVTLQELYQWEEELRVREHCQRRARRHPELYQREEQSPSEGSQALLDTAHHIAGEILSQAELELQGSSQQAEEQRELEESMTAETVRTVTPEMPQTPVNTLERISDGIPALMDVEHDIFSEMLSNSLLEVQRLSQELEEERELEQSRAAEMSSSEGSQALLDFAELISTEILSQAELELRRSIQQLQAQRELEQSRAAKVVRTVPEEREESPVAAPQSPVPAPQGPSESKQALLDFTKLISTEIWNESELELQRSIQQLQAQKELEQTMAAEMVTTVPSEREESPVPAPQNPSEGSQALLDFADRMSTEILSQAKLELRRSIQQLPSTPEVQTQALSELEVDKEAEGQSVQALQETEEGALAGEGIHWKYYVNQEASQWEDEEGQELSQELNTYQKVSQGEDLPEQELFPGQGKDNQKLSDWEEYIEEKEPRGEGKSYQKSQTGRKTSSKSCPKEKEVVPK